MSEARTTTDHELIGKWAEERGGHPAAVRETKEGGDPGLLRIDFDGQEPDLDRIDWDAFFRKFDEKNLKFLYQDRTQSGEISRFCKFVDITSA